MSMSEDASIPSGTTQRKRKVAACHSCHVRKVRCSLAHTGHPCMNCSLDGIECETRVAKRKRASPIGRRQQRKEVASRAAVSVDTGPSTSSTGPEPSLETEVRGNSNSLTDGTNRHSNGLASPSVHPDDHNGDPEQDYQPLSEHLNHHAGQREPATSPSHVDAGNTCLAPIYGDPSGVNLVADICEPERTGKTGHYLVPQRVLPRVEPETMEYLRLQGVFDLPCPEVCEALVRTYFHHVHPFFPVVDPGTIVDVFESPNREGISMHLTWSMFLAAANFADDTTVTTAGFQTRKEMKRTMYRRAKALYDADYERSKLTLIQAVLLMSFWYADTEDRTGPWHWNGVAIGLCQTIGLHRRSDSSSASAKTDPRYSKRHWHQIWWCCFYRETWFSTGQGRPMRIHLAECDATMPSTDAWEQTLADMDHNLRIKYFPQGVAELSRMWVHLLDLTIVLSEILLPHNRVKVTLPSPAEVDDMEHRVRACCLQEDGVTESAPSQTVSSHRHHLELYIETVSLTLHRPFLLARPVERSGQDWKKIVEQRTRSAAATTNRILSNMISADLISICHSMICIALVPALQVHLLDSTSPKKIVQRMGQQNLRLCMIVIEELKKTFFGAEILYRMFTKAQQQIRDRGNSIASLQATPDAGASLPMDQAAMELDALFPWDMNQTIDLQFEDIHGIWPSFDPIAYDWLNDGI